MPVETKKEFTCYNCQRKQEGEPKSTLGTNMPLCDKCDAEDFGD